MPVPKWLTLGRVGAPLPTIHFSISMLKQEDRAQGDDVVGNAGSP